MGRLLGTTSGSSLAFLEWGFRFIAGLVKGFGVEGEGGFRAHCLVCNWVFRFGVGCFGVGESEATVGHQLRVKGFWKTCYGGLNMIVSCLEGKGCSAGLLAGLEFNVRACMGCSVDGLHEAAAVACRLLGLLFF